MARHFTIPDAIQTAVGATLALRVFQRDAFTCVYCGAAGVPLQVDHLRPQAHFTAAVATVVVNAPTNLVTACATCNAAKGPQDLAGFARMLAARGVPLLKVAAMRTRVRAATRRRLP